MKLITIITIVNLLLSVMYSHAQSRVNLHEDKRVLLMYNHKDSIIICYRFREKVKGYFILVSTTKDRDAAYQLKHKLLKSYSGYSVYMSYQTPYFKLKLGDFLLESEAASFNSRLIQDLKIPTLVVSGLINKPANLQKANEQPCEEHNLLLSYVWR